MNLAFYQDFAKSCLRESNAGMRWFKYHSFVTARKIRTLLLHDTEEELSYVYIIKCDTVVLLKACTDILSGSEEGFVCKV